MENMILNKEQFIEIMNNLEKQHNHDMKCAEAFSTLLPNDYTSVYDNSFLYESILNLLDIIFKQVKNASWLDYFIHELDFGKKYKEGCVKSDSKNIDLSDSGKLYDFLIVDMK